MAFMARFKRHLRKVELSIGILLTMTGAAILTGSLANVAQWLLDTFPTFYNFG
jgi:cytochrome c-type biogenesis protein